MSSYGVRLPLAASPLGTVQPIGNTGDLAADVLAAMRVVGANCPYRLDDMRRVLRFYIRGHVADEGSRCGTYPVILHTLLQPLASGVTVKCWLMLEATQQGDAVFWGVATDRKPFAWIHCGHDTMLDSLLRMVILAGGGLSTSDPVIEHWTLVPSEDDLEPPPLGSA